MNAEIRSIFISNQCFSVSKKPNFEKSCTIILVELLFVEFLIQKRSGFKNPFINPVEFLRNKYGKVLNASFSS